MSSVRVVTDKVELGNVVRDEIIRLSQENIADHGYFSVAWSGGSVPSILSGALVNEQKNIDFTKWQVFYADERFVPLNHDDSNHGVLSKLLLTQVPIPQEQIYPINPNASSVEDCAKEYENKVVSVLGPNAVFDLVILGMGPDGHTASLFPKHKILSETSIVASLTDSPKPPPQRVTLTLPVLNKARRTFFVVTGSEKVEALKQIFSNDKDNQLPAGLVSGSHVTWFLDKNAGQEHQSKH
eukprot:c17090_g2_i1.p1 GENE.c17090_g2_i1~~c17090_g2_i1.p1  ORF type:complete len:247 (-),score=121.79 c17090_g2_i1:21-740(-)